MTTLLDKVLVQRGLSAARLAEIDCPDTDVLLDRDQLVERLFELHENQDLVVVLPDFDMDGIASGVIGFAGLAELGFNVALFVPDPKDGYEFKPETIDRLMKEYPDCKAILTCDVGITCYEGVAHAKKLGCEVLVTDHHTQEVGGDVKLKADVIVNPLRLDETYAHPGICGAYVLWQVLFAYVCVHGEDNAQRDRIDRLRVFAGLGTVSDCMPLLYENRQLVRDAVCIMRMVWSEGDNWLIARLDGCPVYARAFSGLFEVIDAFAREGKITCAADIDEQFFAFRMAPMFNSVKRMEGDMGIAFGAFFGANQRECVDTLMEMNAARKALVEDSLKAIEERDQPYAPYIYLSDAPSGMLGLLAASIMNDAINPGPVLVVHKEGKKWKGSGRTPEWYDGYTLLHEAGFFVAGHEHAFGVGITDDAEMKQLHAFLEHSAQKLYQEIQAELAGVVPYEVLIATDGSGDSNIDVPLFVEFASELERYKPFGAGFPEPVIGCKFSPAEAAWSFMGKDKSHLKATLPYGFVIIFWNAADKYDDYISADSLCALGKIRVNVWSYIDYAGQKVERRSLNFIVDRVLA